MNVYNAELKIIKPKPIIKKPCTAIVSKLNIPIKIHDKKNHRHQNDQNTLSLLFLINFIFI